MFCRKVVLRVIRDTFYDILGITWPTLVIFLVILTVIRITYLINNHKKFVFYNELMLLLFITYILLMFELVTLKDISVPSGMNLTPFKEIFRYEFGSKLFIEQVLGNIIIFVPFGFFASYYVNIKKYRFLFIIGLISSSVIEVVQYFLGRSFDVDDILLNMIGATIGYLVFISLNSIKKHLPGFLQNNWFYNILMLLFVGLIFLYFTNYLDIWGL